MPSVAIIGTRGYPSYYGGFETAIRRLAPFLVDAGWEVTVYGRPGATKPADPNRDPRVRTVETWGVERKSVSTLTYGLSAVRHAAREGADVALVMNVANGYWLPILRRAGIPSLVNVDGIEWDRAKWGRFAKKVFRTGATWTARHGSRMVYDSMEIGRRWRDEFGLDGAFIPYGGDVVAEQLPVEQGLRHRGYVLAVARFVPENTIPEFLGAAKDLADTTDVVIVGSSGYGGELDDAARALSQTSDRVHWLGHVSDDQRLNSLWQHAGAYFHGHSVGGTNPALVQAMACGAPIVARDTVYNREVLGDAGIFTAPSAGAIRDAIVSVLADRDLADQLSRAAIARAKDSYTWDAVNGRYESALRALIARTPELQTSGK
ncbi:glycosyltransferase [uncultured Microbacterium sp.]|uniref:glycosyltransferase n=1 Tax=uncultured Microbacterium sp. TaxID=191216 RepID=UPI0028D34A35|nr:glycosyltransferase [uncultured Microbacterium sp.]